MKRITQKDRIVRHLVDYGFITSWEAFSEYGITRLSAIIWTLKHKNGFLFNDRTISTTNRYGEHTHFKEYILEEADVAQFLGKFIVDND